MYFLLIIQQLIASGTHIFAKTVTEQVPPPVVLFFRTLIVSTLYLAYLYIRRKSHIKFEKKDIWIFLFLGFLNIPINQFLFLTSLKYTSAPNVALAYALTPAFVLIMANIFLKESMTFIKTLGVAIAVFGQVLIIAQDGFELGSDTLKGNLLALTASFSWGLYTLIGRNLARKYGGIYSNGLAMIIGTVMFLPIFSFLPVTIELEQISTNNWLQILYIAVITSGVGYALWYVALQKIEASRVAVFNNIQPVFTTILAVIFMDEIITNVFLLGGVLIILGVFLTQRK